MPDGNVIFTEFSIVKPHEFFSLLHHVKINVVNKGLKGGGFVF